MAKTFYTEHEIEDLFKSGIRRLDLNDNVVLTNLAHEKAVRLGMELVKAAEVPVRKPFLTDHSRPASLPTPAQSAAIDRPVARTGGGTLPADLQGRIKTAVVARLGPNIDQAMLDRIIRRVLDQVKV